MPMLNLSQTKTRHKDKLTEQGNAVYPVEAPMPMLNKLHKQQQDVVPRKTGQNKQKRISPNNYAR